MKRAISNDVAVFRVQLMLYLIFILAGNSRAQDPTLTGSVMRGHVSDVQVIPPSVEASSLARYGNQGVSAFRGQPVISIPIYQISGSDISHDISLSANVSGLRPGERAGWAGQGWTLNAGCVITRSVLGAPDLANNYYNAQTTNYAPPHSQKLFEYQDYLDHIDNGTIERQPDLYYFNLGGYSGQFKIAHDGTVLQRESSLLKIIPDNVLQDTFSFRIIDPEGRIYYFTEREQTRMIPTDFGDEPSRNSYTFTSAWYVSRIENPYSLEKIDFEYYAMAGEELQPRNDNSMLSTTVAVEQVWHRAVSGVIACNQYDNTSFSKVILDPFTYIRKKFLKSILLSREGTEIVRVDLNSQIQRRDSPNTEERRLSSIHVLNYLNGTAFSFRTFSFYHSYFTNMANTGYERYRLRLDSLVESSGVSRMPAYIFSYHDASNLPPANTKSLDHWGYFNHKSNISLIPDFLLEGMYRGEMTYGGGADRNPDLEACRSTVLSSIRYPGGGRTEYEYELNRAHVEDRGIDIGGLRLRSITDYSSPDVLAGHRRYSYVQEDGKESGFIGQMPQYTRTSTRMVKGIPTLRLETDPQSLCQQYDREYRTHTLYSTSIYGLGSFEGSHVGYERVTEETVSPSDGRVIGRTVSIYHRGWTGEQEDPLAGKLLNKKTYDIGGRLVREQKSEYARVILGYLHGYYSDVWHWQTSVDYYCKESEYEYVNYHAHDPVPPGCLQTRRIPTIKTAKTRTFTSQEIKLVKEENIEYGDGGTVYEEKNYAYQGVHPLLPSSITLRRSNGDLLVNKKKYIADLDHGSGTRPMWLRNMTNANRLSREVESVLSSKADESAADQVIGANFYEYANNAPLLSRIYRLERLPVGAAFTSVSVDAAGNITRDPRYVLEKSATYLSNGRIRDIVSRDSSAVSYVWDRQFNGPIAINQNSDYRNLANANFETDEAGGWQLDGVSFSNSGFTGKRAGVLTAGARIYKLQLRPAASVLQMEFWKQGGPVRVLVNGGTEVFPGTVTSLRGWNAMSYLLPAGTASLEITGSSATVDDLRLYQGGGSMESFVYSEQGITARLDASNLPVSYEYDGFSRLNAVRDHSRYVAEGYHYQLGQPAIPEAVPATLFYNAQASSVFTKNGCPANGSQPEQVEYIVPYGRHVSAVSQADADSRAQADIQQNGQAYANANGKCLFYNDQRSRMFFKNDCPPEKGLGLRVSYVVPAGKHSSELSKEDANARAEQDIAENGQAYANANGNCSCDAPDKKMINGNCETGTRVEYSSSYLGNSQWECRYRFVFSDGSYSAIYSEINSTACPQNN